MAEIPERSGGEEQQQTLEGINACPGMHSVPLIQR